AHARRPARGCAGAGARRRRGPPRSGCDHGRRPHAHRRRRWPPGPPARGCAGRARPLREPAPPGPRPGRGRGPAPAPPPCRGGGPPPPGHPAVPPGADDAAGVRAAGRRAAAGGITRLAEPLSSAARRARSRPPRPRRSTMLLRTCVRAALAADVWGRRLSTRAVVAARPATYDRVPHPTDHGRVIHFFYEPAPGIILQVS